MATILSYTTLSDYEKSHHTYLNKIFGAKKPSSESMEKGKVLHKAIQDHILGVQACDKLSGFPWGFDRAEYHAKKKHDDEFTFHGYVDMVNFKLKAFLEIKTGREAWTLGRFQRLMQWKYYAWVTNLTNAHFFTCDFDMNNQKHFTSEATQKDLEEAENWAMTQLEGIKSGKLKDDLVDGKCQGCTYGTACLFI